MVYYCINTPILVTILKTPELNQLFTVNPNSGVPIYLQLINQIKQSIRMNLIFQGEKLPSVRFLAAQLQINPMTISKAYAQLELEEVLIRKRGVGMIVASQESIKPISDELDNAIHSFLKTAQNSQLSDSEILILVQQYLSIIKGQ